MLNIHTRSTKNEHHYVQVPETGSLDDIKEQLGQALKVSPAQVSLIYKGKLLKENQSISSLNLDTEKDFFIFHLKAEAPSSPTPSPSPQQPSAPPFANPASTNNAPPFSPPFASPQGPPSSIPSMTSPPFNPNQGGFGGGIPQRPEPAPISEESINLLVEMGFQKEAVTQALRRANGNPDVAYAILTSPGGAAVVDQGGPEFEGGDDAGGGSDYTPNEDTVQTLVSMGFERNNVVKTLQATRGNADAAYDFLERGEIPPPASADPFVQLRNLLQAHPEHLPQIINQLCATNPQLGAQLRANPAIFLRQLGLDPSQFDLAAVQSGGGGGIPGYNPGYGGGGATGYPAQGGFGVPGQGGVSPGGAGGFGPGMGGYPGGAGGFGPGMGGMPGAGGGMGGFPGGAGGMGGYPGGAGGFGPGMGGMPSGAGGMGGFPGGAGGMGGYPGAQRPAYNPPTVDTSSAEFQEAVTTLTSFGFQREKVITALTQANGNPDIAYAILEQQS